MLNQIGCTPPPVPKMLNVGAKLAEAADAGCRKARGRDVAKGWKNRQRLTLIALCNAPDAERAIGSQPEHHPEPALEAGSATIASNLNTTPKQGTMQAQSEPPLSAVRAPMTATEMVEAAPPPGGALDFLFEDGAIGRRSAS